MTARRNAAQLTTVDFALWSQTDADRYLKKLRLNWRGITASPAMADQALQNCLDIITAPVNIAVWRYPARWEWPDIKLNAAKAALQILRRSDNQSILEAALPKLLTTRPDNNNFGAFTLLAYYMIEEDRATLNRQDKDQFLAWVNGMRSVAQQRDTREEYSVRQQKDLPYPIFIYQNIWDEFAPRPRRRAPDNLDVAGI